MTGSHLYPTLPDTEFFTEEQCHIIEIFNKANHPELSIARARVEPGITTAPHLLRGTTEWYYILEGQGEMFLNGNFIGVVRPGDVVHIPADTPQFIRNTGSEDLVFLCICVPGFQPASYDIPDLPASPKPL